jgi:DNA invertase Pin-like site-specific DNA recombinase
MKTAAIYLRVSTVKQGQSGLGIEAQRFAIAAAGYTGPEFVEHESGRKRERVQLAAAIAYSKANGVPLVIAKLDRLARDVEFIFALLRSGLDFHALDYPNLNTMMLATIAGMNQQEAELASQRTKAALAAKVARDGQWRVGTMTATKISLGNQARRMNARVNENNRRAAVVVRYMVANGSSLRNIAAELNQSGFVTRTGKPFAAESVRRISRMFA